MQVICFRLFRLPVFLLFACISALSTQSAHATTYDVGPGQPYTTINSVPWYTLAAGDTVQIHYGVYHEFISITTRGTAAQPIKVVGISDPVLGQPVIDGQNAVVGPYAHFQYANGTPTRGVVVVAPANGAPAGFKPGYITISNLLIRNASGYAPNTLTDAAGLKHPYSLSAAGMYLVSAEHVVVDHVTLTANSNGFFVQSGGDGANGMGTEATESRDITLQYSHIFGNGNPNGDQSRHNLYTEGSLITIQYNLFGPPMAGSLGNNIKDRSAGTVIRYNWIEGGGHLIDLVDPQGSANITVQEPTFSQTFVYGNVLLNDTTTPSGRIVHYGGDQGLIPYDRKGTLYFYNNTVILHENQSAMYDTTVLQLCDSGLSVCGNLQTADVRNNIFYTTPSTPGATPSTIDLGADGIYNIGPNWISPTWVTYKIPSAGVYNGLSNLVVDPQNNPSFTSLAGLNFLPMSGSNAIGKAGPLAPAATVNTLGQSFAISQQYVRDQQVASRASVTDFGAFQSSGANTPTISWSTPNAIPYGTTLSTIQLNASTTVPGTWTYSPAAGAKLNVGTQTLTATFTPTDTVTYTTASSSVAIQVTPTPLMVSAVNGTKIAGTANPTLTATYNGFANGDSAASLAGSPALATTATTTSAVGTYPITVATGTLNAPNYSLSFTNGTLSVTAIASQGTSGTATFQQGVNGYTGNVTATINDMNTDQTYDAHGTLAYNSALNTLALRSASAPRLSSTNSEALLKFTNLSVPTTSTVTSASLTMTFTSYYTNGSYLGFYLNVPWNSAAATNFNWGNRDVNVPWTTHGALGMGTDLISNQAFTVPKLTANGDQTVTIPLSTAVVQNWISNPATNNGVLIVDATSGGDHGIPAYSSTASVLSKRPVLTINYSSSSTVSPPVVVPPTTPPSTTPKWTKLTNLPSSVVANGSTPFIGTDSYMYLVSVTTGRINRMSLATPGAPATGTDITGTGLPAPSSGRLLAFPGMSPNGTLFITALSTGSSANPDVYFWNRSTTAPVWKKVSGWTGLSSSWIYDFTNDSAGYTYFSPAWSGDIWRNTAPNSTTFTKVITGLYGITNGGATGHPTTGGLYQLRIYNLNDGRGDTLWACGEGELDNISLTGSAGSNVPYLTTAQGYVGNCDSLGKSTNSILAVRAQAGGAAFLTSINIATKATKLYQATSMPAVAQVLQSNSVDLLHWMHGTTWMISGKAGTGASAGYLLLSTDDGATWTDISTSGLGSTCTGANLQLGGTSTDHYIYARCNAGKEMWQYGPI